MYAANEKGKFMEIVLTIPDEIVPDLQNGDPMPLSRRALELLALDGYKSGELTEYQLQQMLGLADRFEVHGFLKGHGVYLDYTAKELERKSAAFSALLSQA
jgi:hypothetical protein